MTQLAFDVMPVLLGALLEERQHWREGAACHISDLMRTIEHPDQRRGRGIGSLLRDLKEQVACLDAAMTGDFHDHCEGCGYQVRPGELVISFEDIGEAHAACVGVDPDQLFDGGRQPVDPDSIVVEDGEEPPEPFATVYRSSGLYTDEQIAERLERGRALLRARKAV